jgi:hypothetical protein
MLPRSGATPQGFDLGGLGSYLEGVVTIGVALH